MYKQHVDKTFNTNVVMLFYECMHVFYSSICLKLILFMFNILVKPVCFVDIFDDLHKEKYIHTCMFLQMISGIL